MKKKPDFEYTSMPQETKWHGHTNTGPLKWYVNGGGYVTRFTDKIPNDSGQLVNASWRIKTGVIKGQKMFIFCQIVY